MKPFHTCKFTKSPPLPEWIKKSKFETGEQCRPSPKGGFLAALSVRPGLSIFVVLHRRPAAAAAAPWRFFVASASPPLPSPPLPLLPTDVIFRLSQGRPATPSSLDPVSFSGRWDGRQANVVVSSGHCPLGLSETVFDFLSH